MNAEQGKTKPPRSVRQLALEILSRIDREGAHAEPLLDTALSGRAFADPHDRGLLTELVYGTLRMRGRLDWIIDRIYRGEASALETEVRNILRIGIYQLRFTDRIPAFAAVNEAVALTRKFRPAAAGLVNAVLRNTLRRQDAIPWPDPAKDPGKAVSVIHSHPRWLVERWFEGVGIEETAAVCRANNQIPPLALRVNTLKASRSQAMAALTEEGIAADPAPFSPDGLILSSAAPRLRETASYREGLVRIQDEASQLIARLVAPEPDEQILDLCAGTGGKTLHLAALMRNRGKIVAVDLHPGKLALLREEAKRLGAAIVETRDADAAALPEEFLGAFDRVLLDAPCSGLGTLRRNPEIRWRIAPADIEKCMQTQRHLLGSAAACVKPGGRLVYAVCTQTREENEAVIAGFLGERPDFTLTRPNPAEGIPPALVGEDGFFRTFPHRHGTDGFFAALLVRLP